MNRIYKFGMFLFALSLLSACQKSDDGPSIIVNVDDEFYINLLEEISESERTFQISIKSIHDQECLNYSIENNLSISNQFNRVILTINDIVAPEDCDDGHAPAFKIVPIADIKQEVYQFKINLTTAVKNEGRLTVTEDDYYLEMETDDGFVLLNNRLYKIPDNTIWGYVGYEAEVEKEDAGQFINDLAEISTEIDETANYQEGYYGYFSILQDNEIEFTEHLDHEFHSPFIYYFEGNNDQIMDLIDSHCAEYPNQKIHLFDSRGNELVCD